MKPLVFAFFVLCTPASLCAQKFQWQPSPGHAQVPIWPRKPPDSQPVKGPEFALSSGTSVLVAGKSATEVDNVTQPTMTMYSPNGRIRAPQSSYPKAPMALEDAQRTMRLTRFHAAEYHIDPRKIGVLGFSAGGYLVADISTNFDKHVYSTVDEPDKVSCRPDFAVAIYPGHLQASSSGLELNPKIPVTRNMPPTFLLQAEDDHVDNVNDSLVYYIALKNAGVPVEMHLYAQGGHAFGLRRTNLPITKWPELVERWLMTFGMIPR